MAIISIRNGSKIYLFRGFKEDLVNVRGILTPPEAGKTAWYMTIM